MAGSLHPIPEGVSEEHSRLLPEYHVLQNRFELWMRQLKSLHARIEKRPESSAELRANLQSMQRIADALVQQFALFFEQHHSAAEPETLRRLLIHGEKTARRCEAQIASWEVGESATGTMIDLFHELLMQPYADGKPLAVLVDRMQDHAELHRDCWTFLDGSYLKSTAEHRLADEFRRIPTRCPDTLPDILQTGVACAQIAAQASRAAKLSRENQRSILSACLLQDAGFLLLERRFRCSPGELRRISPDEFERHPRFGAALAEGISGLSVDVLRAVRNHHRRLTSADPESDDLSQDVAVVTRFHELYSAAACVSESDNAEKRIDTPAGKHHGIETAMRTLETETRLGDWNGDICRALQVACQTGIVPLSVTSLTAVETPTVSLSAPHFLETSLQGTSVVLSTGIGRH